jgi:hypothetical protein
MAARRAAIARHDVSREGGLFRFHHTPQKARQALSSETGQLDRLKDQRIVVLGLIHPRRNRPHAHRLGWEWAQQVGGSGSSPDSIVYQVGSSIASDERRLSYPAPLLIEFHSLHVLSFIVHLVGFCLTLSFSPGSCTRAKRFLVTLAINKDGP